MMLSITRVIEKIAQKAFEKMLLSGAFPDVNYSKSGGFVSYSMFAYCDKWGKFTKILDKWMKEELDPELGIFTRKHSAKFLAEVEKLANEITEADMLGQREHFHTFADSLMESLQ
jgi:hypothetical protein